MGNSPPLGQLRLGQYHPGMGVAQSNVIAVCHLAAPFVLDDGLPEATYPDKDCAERDANSFRVTPRLLNPLIFRGPESGYVTCGAKCVTHLQRVSGRSAVRLFPFP